MSFAGLIMFKEQQKYSSFRNSHINFNLVHKITKCLVVSATIHNAGKTTYSYSENMFLTFMVVTYWKEICRKEISIFWEGNFGLRRVEALMTSLQNWKSYFADLRMTFRQNIFLQDWFRNKLRV
jgi:hypothetical protein